MRFKALLRGMFRWNVLLKSAFVATVVGAALTYVNYGYFLNDTVWPPWWKLVVNFAIPFGAEALLCIALNTYRPSELTEVILHEIKQDQHALTPLPEVAVYSGLVPQEGLAFKTIDNEFCQDTILPSRHTWPVPESPPSYLRTHNMFTVDELADVEERDLTAPVEIRPLPKENARRPARAKSLGCISDLHGRQRIRISNADRLHVFNNGLYAGDSPPSSGPSP